MLFDIVSKKDKNIGSLLMGETPRALTIEEIVYMEDKFAEAALTVKAMEGDGIEVHSAHGYLTGSFLSPRSNQRTDKYGGSLENRARFTVNQCRKAREACGDDFVIGLRVSGDELIPDGIHHDEMVEVVKMCAPYLDYINVSGGCYDAVNGMFPWKENFFNEWATSFRQAAGLPVMCPGIHQPDHVKKALEESQVLRCNECVISIFDGKKVNCAMNPTAGYEKYMPELWRTNSPAMQSKVDKFTRKRAGLYE
jgi:2,4-dienoyl-CoA reductase-like NADH-dependent reductase (Old Yellow Enzyme family)